MGHERRWNDHARGNRRLGGGVQVAVQELAPLLGNDLAIGIGRQLAGNLAGRVPVYNEEATILRFPSCSGGLELPGIERPVTTPAKDDDVTEGDDTSVAHDPLVTGRR
jgi:hypothetical protein